mmetsp:Transcript_41264/g.96440  ORF Transcript_41264/g.96440 Transcript_41264/m.96440 type:complete len:200 (-) Transcript_41264:648-1247(-)
MHASAWRVQGWLSASLLQRGLRRKERALGPLPHPPDARVMCACGVGGMHLETGHAHEMRDPNDMRCPRVVPAPMERRPVWSRPRDVSAPSCRCESRGWPAVSPRACSSRRAPARRSAHRLAVPRAAAAACPSAWRRCGWHCPLDAEERLLAAPPPAPLLPPRWRSSPCARRRSRCALPAPTAAQAGQRHAPAHPTVRRE